MSFFDKAWYVNYGNGSSTGYYSVPVWPGAAQAVTAGTWCRQATTPTVGNERCFVALSTGITGASEPTWTVTRGAKNTDNTVTWQECTGMAGPCGDTTNAPLWAASTAFTLGEVIYEPTSGSLQILSTASGNTLSSKPTFSATAGVTTSDSSNVWTSLGPASNYTTGGKYPHARLANAMASTWGQAGNQIFVNSSSAETQAATITLQNGGSTSAKPYQIASCSFASVPPTSVTAGASVSTTGAFGIQFCGTGFGAALYALFSGITFNAGSSTNAGSINLINSASTEANLWFENCTFVLNNSSSSSNFNLGGSQGSNSWDAVINIKNCSFVFGATSQKVIITGGQIVECIGCTFAGSGSVPTTFLSLNTNGSMAAKFRDCDLSAVTGTILSIQSLTNSQIVFENCKLGSGVTPTSGSYSSTGGGFLRLQNCDSAATNYRYSQTTYSGTVNQETTVVRSGSKATDGTTPISWNLTTNSGPTLVSPLVSEEIAQWNSLVGSLRTATMYFTSNASLTNASVWVEIEYLSSTGSPLGSTTNSRQVLLGTATALTSDTSTWGGSITNKYRVAVTFTPQMAGPVKARIYVGAPSITVYADPYIYIT